MAWVEGTGMMNYCWYCGRWSEIIYLQAICAKCLNDLGTAGASLITNSSSVDSARSSRLLLPGWAGATTHPSGRGSGRTTR